MSLGRAVLLAFVLATGCERSSGQHEATAASHARLGPGIAARVGSLEIPVTLVADVARTQRVEPREALERLVDDALAAQASEASGAARDPATAWALESVAAASVADRLRIAAHAAGPPTDAEIAELSAMDWREVDLPEQVKVMHAVVLHPKDQAQLDAARALATKLAAAVAGATSDDDFEARAKALPAGPFTVRVERLPAFVSDGRSAEGEPSGFDPAFVRGAFALRTSGQTSGVVESPYGFHVIRLIERRPPKVLTLEERRAKFAHEIEARRAHEALTHVLESRGSATPVEIQPGAEARMEAVTSKVAP